MLDTPRRQLRIALETRSVLRRLYGRSWPLALARCLLRARGLAARTRWAGRRDEEARQVRVLALLPAFCLDLRDRLGERATEATRELTSAAFEAENARILAESGLSAIAEPRERWHAFFERVLVGGRRAFDETECLSLESERFHVRVFRCLFAEAAAEMGLPELARMACDLEVPFYERLLPTHEFHRNGTGANTLAYGHVCCEYVWESRFGALPLAHDQAASTGAPGSAEKRHPDSDERRVVAACTDLSDEDARPTGGRP